MTDMQTQVIVSVAQNISMTPERRKWFKQLFRQIGREHLAPDRLAEKASVATRIAEVAEDGKFAVVHGGRDCDMSQWEGSVSILPASVMAYQRWAEQKDQWADGPWWVSAFKKPSETDRIERRSRDLAMEAYEDGHPHVVYAPSPGAEW